MKLLQKECFSGKNIPMLLLLTAGVLEFLMIVLESCFSGIAYYLTETWLVVPCLLFLGCQLGRQQEAFARRRLLLAVAAVSWFVIVQLLHKLSGAETHPMGTVLFVYLMAFPFASAADDRENTGIFRIGGLFVAAALVLVGYSAVLLLNRVPEAMQDFLYWDGARLHALWHPNITACYLMIGIGFSAAFWAQAKKPWVKGLLLAAIVVQFLVMSLTNCRTMLLMTGAFLGGIAFFRIFRGSWKQLLLGLLAAAVLLIGSFKLSGVIFRWNNDRLIAAQSAAAAESLMDESAVNTEEMQTENALALDDIFVLTVAAEEILMDEPAVNTEEMQAENALALDGTGVITGENPQGTLANDMRTLNGRTVIWKSALTAIRDDKSLALWGTAYPGTVISVYNPFEVVHAHNSWMEALMRMGLPGLLMSLIFTAISLWSGVRLILGKKTEYWKRILAMMTMCLMVAGFLEPYLFITNVYYHILDFMFFFCTGYLDFWCHLEKKR